MQRLRRCHPPLLLTLQGLDDMGVMSSDNDAAATQVRPFSVRISSSAESRKDPHQPMC